MFQICFSTSKQIENLNIEIELPLKVCSVKVVTCDCNSSFLCISYCFIFVQKEKKCWQGKRLFGTVRYRCPGLSYCISIIFVLRWYSISYVFAYEYLYYIDILFPMYLFKCLYSGSCCICSKRRKNIRNVGKVKGCLGQSGIDALAKSVSRQSVACPVTHTEPPHK